MNDPYEALEVNKKASQEEIKKVYRRLAKKYHPDFNPGNKEAEKKFKTIQHAFDLIGTPEARAKWDKGETDEQMQTKYEESQKRGREKPFYYNTQDTGGRYSYSFGEDLGGEDFFESLFGGRGRTQEGKRRRKDEIYQMEVDFKEAAIGGEKVINLPSGKTLKVKIPAGIEEGMKLKFKDIGENGDVYVEIKVRPMAGLKRSGLDIETEVPISFFEALLGGDIQVPTVEGPVMLKVPPGVSTGTRLRIRGKGAGSGESRGHQLVVLKIIMPKNVPPELSEEVKKLRSHFDYDPRTSS